jgi:proteasome accessory factor A
VVGLVAHGKAGERILEGLLVDADRRLREEGIVGDIYLFKNNTDSAGNSYGCHENSLVGRHGEFARLADSQRAEHIWEGVSSATTGPGRSSTPATSRTPTRNASAACTSSSTNRT